jgi:FMN phosphatase YigB (HAD superfamily)
VEIEAVTIDAYGTLVTLRDPVPGLQGALARRGIERDAADVQRAFEAGVAFYVGRSHEGRDDPALALLRRDCARVFLEVVPIADAAQRILA